MVSLRVEVAIVSGMFTSAEEVKKKFEVEKENFVHEKFVNDRSGYVKGGSDKLAREINDFDYSDRDKTNSKISEDVDAPEDASWTDRYIGIVELAGIVICILY